MHESVQLSHCLGGNLFFILNVARIDVTFLEH